MDLGPGETGGTRVGMIRQQGLKDAGIIGGEDVPRIDADAFVSIPPQLACGGWMPRPRKLSPASMSNATPSISEVWTTSDGVT